MRHNREAIERALNIHLEGGLILKWMVNADDNRWIVRVTGGDDLVMTLKETHMFVYGLASAKQAFKNRGRD